MAGRMRAAAVLAALGALHLAGVAARASESEPGSPIAGLRRGDAEAKQRLIQMGAPAVAPLFALLGDKEPRVAWAARSTLRWIALRAAEPSAPAGRRKEVLDAVLPYLQRETPSAEQQAAAKELSLLPEVLEGILPHLKPAHTLAERRVAVEMLGLVGTQAEVPLLGRLFLQDESLAEAVVLALSQLEGGAGQGDLSCIALHGGRHLDRYAPDLGEPRPIDPAIQAQAIRLYASHCAGSAMPAFDRRLSAEMLAKTAKHADEGIRVAAIEGLGLIGEMVGEPAILDAIREGTPKVKAAAFRSCLALGLARLQAQEGTVARGVCERALELAADDSQRAAALSALGRVGDPDSLPRIAACLKAEAPLVRRAAYAALAQMKGSAGTNAIADALPGAPADAKPLLLHALGTRREPGVARLLAAAARDADETVALAAIGALDDLGEPGATPDLLDVAERARDVAVRAAAVRVAIRLAGALAERKQGAAASEAFRRALRLVHDDADRAECLRGMGKAADPKAVDTLLAIAEKKDDPLRDLALEACLAVAEGAVAAGNHAAAAAAYKRVADLQPADSIAGEVMRKLAALGFPYNVASRQGFITSWWMIGPFPAPDFNAAKKAWFPQQEVALGKTYDAEGRKLNWTLVHSDDPKGAMRLKDKFQPTEKAVAYGYVELVADAPREVRLNVARDDGLSVWLNGQALYDVHDAHGLAAGETAVDARLVPGVNRLLVKTSNGGGPWEFSVRLTDRAGKPLGGEQK